MKFILAIGFLIALFLLADLAVMRKLMDRSHRAKEKLAVMNGPITAYFSSPKIRATEFPFDSSLYQMKFRSDSAYADSVAGLWRQYRLEEKTRLPISAVVEAAYRDKSLPDADQGFLLGKFHVYYRDYDSILYSGDRDRFSTWIFRGSVIMEREYRGDSVLSVVWNRKPG